MNKIYQVYQVSDSTGETLDRIFEALKAQFSDFECKTIHYSFTRTKTKSWSKREFYRQLKSKNVGIAIAVWRAYFFWEIPSLNHSVDVEATHKCKTSENIFESKNWKQKMTQKNANAGFWYWSWMMSLAVKVSF